MKNYEQISKLCHTLAVCLLKPRIMNELNFRLRVENRNTANTEGTVRIFLLPIKDATGYDFSFDARRSLAIEIDQFRCKCKNSK